MTASTLGRCWLLLCGVTLSLPASRAAMPSVHVAPRARESVVVASAAQPTDFRYLAFPTLLSVGEDEAWIAFKAGRSHATDAGAAIEVVQHTWSTGATKLIQRIPAPPLKLYQMGELARMPDESILLLLDVQSLGWDNRHYRSGAEVLRWSPARKAFDAAVPLGLINDRVYGYPFDLVSAGRSTWQLIMAFGYNQPGGRWSVDAVRSEDSGRSWSFVRDLTHEFGGIQANESALVRHGTGFIVTTRGYDRVARLHRTDGNFRVQHQVELTGKYPFINSYIGRPRLFVRDGVGYLIGRNWTRPIGASAEPGATASEMQLCLFRFDLETLALTSCVVLDNADNEKVTDGYYAVTAYSGTGDTARFHVVTYKGVQQRAPDIVRIDYRWDDVK